MSDRKNIIFDSQILTTVQACPQKVDLTFNNDLKPAEGNAAPLEEGDLLHRMFEFYNHALCQFKTEIIYDNGRYENLIKAILDYGQFVSPTLNLIPAECSEVLFQFEKYVRHTRMDGVEILEVERPFIYELYKDDELGVFYTGKIDRLTNTPNYGIIPRDYKKAAQKKEPEHLSNQFTGYCVATNSDIIIIDKVGFQKTLTPEDRFRSYPLYYNAFQKQEWIEDTIWWARQYAFYIETDTWPRNRSSCDKYAGCIFRRICDANNEEMRQHVIKTDFIIGDKWDPTEVLVKDKKSAEHQTMMKFAGDYGIDLVIK